MVGSKKIGRHTLVMCVGHPHEYHHRTGHIRTYGHGILMNVWFLSRRFTVVDIQTATFKSLEELKREAFAAYDRGE